MAFASHSNVVLSALPITMDNNNNDLLLQALVLQHWLEAESDQETLENVQLAAATLIIGSNKDHAWAVENRCCCRQYLGRTALLPNPHIGTP